MNDVGLVLCIREGWGLWQSGEWMFYPKEAAASLFQLTSVFPDRSKDEALFIAFQSVSFIRKDVFCVPV